jgi:aminoglycoside phosphotransferase (APT) family kinase protein
VHRWSPELRVDEGHARALIGSQFPELELSSMRLLGEGWDNTVWLVDRSWVFRFPRREVAAACIERELRVLPRLAGHLPAAIPVPRFVGRRSDSFPWTFFGTAVIEGTELGAVHTSRGSLARDLGTFLRTLHGVDVRPESVESTVRADMSRRVPLAHDALADVRQLGLWSPPDSAYEVLEIALSGSNGVDVTVLLHGDLHFRHVLVDGDARLTGVIDWGDASVGPCGVDLALYWSAFSDAEREAFLAAYGLVPAYELLRARTLALWHNALLAVFGYHQRMDAVTLEAIASLRRTVAG